MAWQVATCLLLVASAYASCNDCTAGEDGGALLQTKAHMTKIELSVERVNEACAGNGVTYGDRFIQIGEWRIGDVDGNHFSVSHKGGQTSQIYQADGTLHAGPRTDFSTWTRTVGTPRGVSFGDRFIQIGDWRMGDVDGGHFSVSHKGGQTALVYMSIGTAEKGPGTDFSTWTRTVGTPSGISIGDRFIQIGEWRIGDVDGGHVSVSHKDGQTAIVHRSDGTAHAGPRTDFSTWSRNMTFKYDAKQQAGTTILFTKKYIMGSTQMRADDVAYFFNHHVCAVGALKAISLKCEKYQKDYCGREATLGVFAVVAVKHHCPCAYSTAIRIWDPVDNNMNTQGGTATFVRHGPDRYWAYIVSNSELKNQLVAAGAKHVFVIPHHYSNYWERRRNISIDTKAAATLAFAGKEEQAVLTKDLEDYMRSRNKSVRIIKLDQIDVNRQNAKPPNSIGDLFAMRAQSVDVGIAWSQPMGLRIKLLENSAQRMSNLMSVGVPTLGYAGYLAEKELVGGALYNKLATVPSKLFQYIYDLITNSTLYSMAQEEALQLAAKHSPHKICRMYLSMFNQTQREATQFIG